jgi:hypothetical protein
MWRFAKRRTRRFSCHYCGPASNGLVGRERAQGTLRFPLADKGCGNAKRRKGRLANNSRKSCGTIIASDPVILVRPSGIHSYQPD